MKTNMPVYADLLARQCKQKVTKRNNTESKLINKNNRTSTKGNKRRLREKGQ